MKYLINGQLKDIRDMDLTEILSLVERGVLAEPVVKRIPLDNARTKEFMSLTGNYFAVINASALDATISVGFNRADADLISFTQGLIMRRPYTKLFISNTAQAGTWVDLLIGTTSPELLEVLDNRTALVSSTLLTNILDQLKGGTAFQTWDTEKTVGLAEGIVIASNVLRKGAMIQAKSSNTGKIYIGFNNTVTSTKWVAELSPGMSFSIDDYQGDLYAISDTAGQLAGWGEW